MHWQWIIFFLFTLKNVIHSSAFDCFLHYKDYRCRLGTKTPYRFIANYNDSPLEYPGCTPKKIWLLLRHGTRYPGEKYVPRIIRELPKLQKLILENYHENKTTLTQEDAALLANWTLTFNESDIMRLAEEGENEMIDLGERYQTRFPTLMPEVYDNSTYKFKYTATQRTRESARHFAAGLFGSHMGEKVWYPEPEHKDPILRFYKRCLRWRSEIDSNPNARVERDKFVKSKASTDMLLEVSKRIGYPVDYETVRLMYIMCGFEIAWAADAESPWCNIFSANDFRILEFADDLEYYWIDGYGHKLTYEQACPVLRDVFDFFTSNEGPKVSAYFTHSGTLLKLLALLGVAKDYQRLTHDLYPLYADDRAWRTSVIDAFATNVAFVLYDCTSEGPSVLFMHQERPMYLPGCSLNKPCPLSYMKALYPDHEEECPFDDMCQIAENDSEP